MRLASLAWRFSRCRSFQVWRAGVSSWTGAPGAVRWAVTGGRVCLACSFSWALACASALRRTSCWTGAAWSVASSGWAWSCSSVCCWSWMVSS